MTSKRMTRSVPLEAPLPPGVRRPPVTGLAPTDVGSLVHTLIAVNAANRAIRRDRHAARSVLLQQARSLVSGSNHNRRHSVASQALSLAIHYLCDLAPSQAELVGVELPIGNGRVDVAWSTHKSRAVFFDSLKTTRVASGRPASSALSQAHLYLVEGLALHGRDFLGVRILVLGDPWAHRLLTATGMRLLVPTPQCPFGAPGVIRK